MRFLRRSKLLLSSADQTVNVVQGNNVIMAVCCDNKRNIQVRTVVKMQSFNVNAGGTHVYHFALSFYTKKSDTFK